jgi:uncharacterized protein (DUF1501 family)
MATKTITRRDLLRGPRLLFQPEVGPAGDVLVSIFLRGGMDGLHTVPPHGDPAYRSYRPTLALPEPGKAGGIVDLDGFYGLHADMAPLAEIFRAKQLAIVHASGSPDKTLSHFEAMQTMERGVADGNLTASGWISRHIASTEKRSSSPMRAIAFGDVLPKSLQGALSASAVRSLKEFRLQVPEPWSDTFRGLLTDLYNGADDPAAITGRETLELLKTIEKLDPDAYAPAGGAKYPEGGLGSGLRQIAQLIKAEVGLEVAAVDLGGWDAHAAQGPLMGPLMKELARGLHAFHADLGDKMKRVTVVAMSEFGRRVNENTSLGTDHGRATAMFLMGGAVRGGKVYGRWPGMAKDQLDKEGQLDKDGNLRVTTDYRDILSEIVDKRLNNPNLEQVFPKYKPSYLGLTV